MFVIMSDIQIWIKNKEMNEQNDKDGNRKLYSTHATKVDIIIWFFVAYTTEPDINIELRKKIIFSFLLYMFCYIIRLLTFWN